MLFLRALPKKFNKPLIPALLCSSALLNHAAFTAEENLMPNPGAEETIPAAEFPAELKTSRTTLSGAVPKDWALYNGNGYATWGVSTSEVHSGKYSAYAAFEKLADNNDTINIALCLGPSNGYNWTKAMTNLAGRTFSFSFWAKGDLPVLRAAVFGWKAPPGENAFAAKRVYPTSLNAFTPQATWQRYSGTFMLPADVKCFVLALFLEGTAATLQKGQAIYVDDVEINSFASVARLNDGNPAQIRVAVYNGEGRADKPLLIEALACDTNISAAIINDLRPQTLEPFDVLICSLVKDVASTDRLGLDSGENWPLAILNFADSGKGVILGHDCVGYRGDFGNNKLFPAIGIGTGRSEWQQTLLNVAPEHPVMRDMPQSFSHAYFDHIIIKPGQAGTVVAKDEDGNAVVVAGEIGRGRVLSIGYPMGLHSERLETDKRRDFTAPLNADEQRLLINGVKWCAAAPKYRVSMALTKATLYADMVAKNNELRELDLEKWQNLPAPQFNCKEITIHIGGNPPKAIEMDSEEKIIRAVENCKKMGFNAVKTYARSVTATFPSENLPLDRHEFSSGRKVDETFDPVGIMTRAARERGMKTAFYVCPFRSKHHWLEYPGLTEAEAKDYRSGKFPPEKLSHSSAFWRCPDHPEVRAIAIAETRALIRKYQPDEIWLDYIRYKNEMGGCFCDYSVKAREAFAAQHPELKPEEVLAAFNKQSILSFAEAWVKACKEEKPDIICSAYSHPEFANEFPLDCHSQRISRGLADNWGQLQNIHDYTKRLCEWVKVYHPDCRPYPFIDYRDDKSGRRIYLEYAVVSKVMDDAGITNKCVDAFAYNMLVDADGNIIREDAANGISRALGGTWGMESAAQATPPAAMPELPQLPQDE